MKVGVIYARYSSDKQNEQSIAGQVDVCKKWAKDNDVKIIGIYSDEAITGKTDKRPEFQRMIKDAKLGKFEYVVVYKVDRFSRNRYDSAIYKAQLKKSGVRLMSAMESIADGPEGIILESVLEGMAEYYSANLSQNVLRGMRLRAECAGYLGGTIPLGYKLSPDKTFVIDPDTAPVVKQIYTRYASGRTIREIMSELNLTGYKTSKGKPFAYDSLHRILTNAKYIGKYEHMGIVLNDAIPRIIDDITFKKVQQRIEKNKHAPASAKANTTFYLTGKLFCGKCGSSMVGDSGTSKNGNPHYYYTCLERKRKHGCKKKSVRKDMIEKLVTDITINKVLTDENIEYMAKAAYELYEKERTDASEITALQSTLRETQKVIDNIMRAIEQGIITDTTKSRLMEAEDRRKAILVSIAKAEIKKPPLTQEQIKFFLCDMKNRVCNPDERNEIIINTFINAVYLYDDRIVLTYNFCEGESLKKIELSDLEKFGFGDVRYAKSENSVLCRKPFPHGLRHCFFSHDL